MDYWREFNDGSGKRLIRKYVSGKWNNYPRVSKLSYDAIIRADFVVGAGPSLSFSLRKPDYNATELPYLQQKLTSTNYFDIAADYHFNKANLFMAISFRNPSYKT